MHPLLVNLHRNSIFRSMYTYSGLTGHHSRTQSIPGPDMQLINSSITPSNDVFFVPPSDKPWSFQIFNSKTDSGGPFSQIFLLRRLQYWQDGAVSGINYPGYVCRMDPSGSTAFFCSSFALKCSHLRNTYVFSVKSEVGRKGCSTCDMSLTDARPWRSKKKSWQLWKEDPSSNR